MKEYPVSIYKRNGELIGVANNKHEIAYLDLVNANLVNLDLSRLRFANKNMSGAILDFSDLSCSDLSNSNLSKASLKKTNLFGANLGHSIFRCAKLLNCTAENSRAIYANFSGANMRNSNFRYSDLHNSIFSYTDLIGTDFSFSALIGTYLDDEVPIQGLSAAELREAGFHVRLDWVYGYRAKESYIATNPVSKEIMTYSPGKTYKAPFFSRDIMTSCHPGLYFCPTLDEAKCYSHRIVKVRAKVGTVIQAIDKFRTPELFVVKDIKL